jgi:hypothetical protein
MDLTKFSSNPEARCCETHSGHDTSRKSVISEGPLRLLVGLVQPPASPNAIHHLRACKTIFPARPRQPASGTLRCYRRQAPRRTLLSDRRSFQKSGTKSGVLLDAGWDVITPTLNDKRRSFLLHLFGSTHNTGTNCDDPGVLG